MNYPDGMNQEGWSPRHRPPVPPKPFQKVFQGDGTDFSALWEAESWLKNQGISWGSSSVDGPQSLMFGDYSIGEWRNMTRLQQSQCHGTLMADRSGPAVVDIKAEWVHLLLDQNYNH